MEVANCLYGITMGEPGISKVLSVRLAAEGPVEREVETAPERLAGSPAAGPESAR
jgi:hypothetical protein